MLKDETADISHQVTQNQQKTRFDKLVWFILFVLIHPGTSLELDPTTLFMSGQKPRPEKSSKVKPFLKL